MAPQPGLVPSLRVRIEALTGKRVVGARTVDGRGYTPAERWIVTLEDGETAFAKTGTDVGTSRIATWLRAEQRAYSAIDAAFMPRMLGWDDDGLQPLLLLEDLSHATWPPPWTPSSVETVRLMLQDVASTMPPPDAPDLEAIERDHLSGWRSVAADPRPFLGLGLVTERWLKTHLGALLAASDSAVLAGDSLVHFDVRSDNLCIVEDGAKLIDWNGYARGNPLFDLAAWLPSLHHEGGPPPWELLEDSGGLSVLIAGYLAARAGLPPIPTAPRVRGIQRDQLLTSLPWAIRELGLPAPKVK